MSPHCSASVDPVSSFQTNFSTLFNRKHEHPTLNSLKCVLLETTLREEGVKKRNGVEFSHRFYRWRDGKEVKLHMVATYKERKPHPLPHVIYMLSWLPRLLHLSCTTQRSQTYNEAYDKQTSDTILYTNITFHLADAFIQSDVYMKYNPSHRWQWCFMSVMQYQPSSCCLLYFSSLPWCSKDIRTTENIR